MVKHNRIDVARRYAAIKPASLCQQSQGICFLAVRTGRAPDFYPRRAEHHLPLRENFVAQESELPFFAEKICLIDSALVHKLGKKPVIRKNIILVAENRSVLFVYPPFDK